MLLVAGLAAVIAAVSLILFEPLVGLIGCALGWTMLAIAIADARRFIVPDVLSLPAIPIGVIVAYVLDDGYAATPAALDHCAAAVLGGVAFYGVRYAYQAWRDREGLGLGDVKLAAAAGAWVGLAGLGPVLLLASVLAIFSVLARNIADVRAIRGTMAVPFGVFLAPAIWFVWCAAMLGLDPLLPLVPPT
jgi:leader peptidase (prepilin peptidase)/N-methyltransferase